AVVSGTRQVSAGGPGKPLVLLAAGGVLSILRHGDPLSGAGPQTPGIKALSYFLSFLLAYVLVSSPPDRLPAPQPRAGTAAVGGTVIAIAAIYEARTHYDVFDHLHKWISFLEPTRAVKEPARRGTRLRVHASAQHPIALGAALTMTAPFAVYFASRARAGLTR